MRIDLLKSPALNLCFVVMGISLLLSNKAFASSLYTISGPSGGTSAEGYYTIPPSLTVVLDSTYPEPCVAQGGTVPGNGTINVVLSSPVGSNLDGSYDWQVLEDTISHALLVTNDGNWHDGHILNSCNWNGPNPNWQVVWDQTIKYDMSSPTVNITSPTNNANETTGTVSVTGTVGDNGTGIQSVTVNGVTASVNNNVFTANIPLNMGLNELVATATDKVGHQTQSTRVTVFRYENASNGSTSLTAGSGNAGGSASPNNSQGRATGESAGQKQAQSATESTTSVSAPIKVAAGAGAVGATGIGVASFMGYIPYRRIGTIAAKLLIK